MASKKGSGNAAPVQGKQKPTEQAEKTTENARTESAQILVPEISVRIDKIFNDETKKLKAFASANIGPFAVHGIRVFENEKGMFVNRGEKAITLLEPGNEFTREDGTTGFSVNVKRMFDVSQTNSRRDYSRREPDERRVLKALIAASPCDIRMTNELEGNVCARYVPKDDAIYIRQGLD